MHSKRLQPMHVPYPPLSTCVVCLPVCLPAGGTVIQIGACDDKFTAADTAKLSATAYTGAATYSFIESVERYGPQQSYASLLSNMTATLRSLGKSSVKPQTAGSAVASGALPLIGAIALGPLGLLAGLAVGTGMGECGTMFVVDLGSTPHEVRTQVYRPGPTRLLLWVRRDCRCSVRAHPRARE